MTEQQLKSEIGQIQSRIHELNIKKEELQNQLAQLKCPFSAGDTIEFGFTRRVKRIVKLVRHSYGGWELIVQHILKSGKLGANSSVLSVHRPVKVTA